MALLDGTIADATKALLAAHYPERSDQYKAFEILNNTIVYGWHSRESTLANIDAKYIADKIISIIDKNPAATETEHRGLLLGKLIKDGKLRIPKESKDLEKHIASAVYYAHWKDTAPLIAMEEKIQAFHSGLAKNGVALDMPELRHAIENSIGLNHRYGKLFTLRTQLINRLGDGEDSGILKKIAQAVRTLKNRERYGFTPELIERFEQGKIDLHDCKMLFGITAGEIDTITFGHQFSPSCIMGRLQMAGEAIPENLIDLLRGNFSGNKSIAGLFTLFEREVDALQHIARFASDPAHLAQAREVYAQLGQAAPDVLPTQVNAAYAALAEDARYVSAAASDIVHAPRPPQPFVPDARTSTTQGADDLGHGSQRGGQNIADDLDHKPRGKAGWIIAGAALIAGAAVAAVTLFGGKKDEKGNHKRPTLAERRHMPIPAANPAYWQTRVQQRAQRDEASQSLLQ